MQSLPSQTISPTSKVNYKIYVFNEGNTYFWMTNLCYRLVQRRVSLDGFIGYQYHKNSFEMTDGLWAIYVYTIYLTVTSCADIMKIGNYSLRG